MRSLKLLALPYFRQLGVAGRYLVRAAKALVISEPIAIFYPRDGKS